MKEDLDLKEEELLKLFANIILIIGILAFIILIFSYSITPLMNKDEVNWIGVGSAIFVLLSSASMSYFFKVISNISISLKNKE